MLCMSAPKDLANRWTHIAFLSRKLFYNYLAGLYLFLGVLFNSVRVREITTRKKYPHEY